MRFDLSKLDYTKEVTEQLKKQYFEIVNDMIKKGWKDNSEKREVTLFHGTSLYYLNNILLHGLAPSQETNQKNFEGDLESHTDLVYLTNKWHYWYAYNTYSRLEKKETSPFHTPSYVECKVPTRNLIIDEDFFHSTYIKNRIKSCIKKKNPFLELSYEESLNHYATVAHLGRIERKQIVSFTILANVSLLYKNFIDEKSQYQRELSKWGNGKGKGQLNVYDLFRLEDDPGNLTFMLKDIPEQQVIVEFIPREGENKFALKFGKVSTNEC